MRIFVLIWSGQLVSLIGSSITAFALGVWIYQEMGSVTQYSLISLSAIVPFLLVSPFAGTVADRWNRRYVMIVSDLFAALCTLAILLLLSRGDIRIWHICLLNALNSAFGAFQYPAFTAATTLLVPERHLTRAAGMTQAGRAVTRLMISPILAGVLLETVGLQGILLLDFGTFIFAFIILMTVRIPDAKTTAAGKVGKGSLTRETFHGWAYIARRRGLFGLLIFFAAGNFFLGLAYVLFTPLILSFASAAMLGAVVTVGGAGMLVGGLAMGLLGETRRLMDSIFGFSFLIGLCILSAGFHMNLPLLGTAVFIYFFGKTMIGGSVQVLVQKTVEEDLQGRVFATVGAIAAASLPLAYMIAGPLADQIFEPLMGSGNFPSGIIDRLIHRGAGRGIRLMFAIIGASTVLLSIFGYLYRPLRRIEKGR